MTSLGSRSYSELASFMGLRHDIFPAFERRVGPAASHPDRPDLESESRSLEVSVVFTSAEATLSALKRAGALAQALSARITLIVPQVVPYPLPLATPPVLLDFQEARLQAIAAESMVETTVRIYLCRDPWDALTSVLRPRSLLVIGARRNWWFTPERRLARKLRNAGHEVIITGMEPSHV
jgi:hypothetical protein